VKKKFAEDFKKTLKNWHDLREMLERWAREEGARRLDAGFEMLSDGFEITIQPDSDSVEIGWFWPGGGITRIYDFHYSCLVDQETFGEVLDRAEEVRVVHEGGYRDR
jgi:hypothetical protein